MREFTYAPQATRVVFGAGARGRVGEEAERLGIARALLVSTPEQEVLARKAVGAASDTIAATFAGAAMHTPVAVTERAMEVVADERIDGLIAVGGGSTIGLAKAIAVRTGLPHIAVPTTYAGSEMTPILGETADGEKTTRRDAAILPEAAIYDVELTMSLPPAMSVASGVNAIAHAVEALYAHDRNPVVEALAASAIHALGRALPVIAATPGDADARSGALYGAWACGTCLGQVSMALHHKLCHVLGGSFDLPHAQTHSVVLPHATAFNAGGLDRELDPVTDALGGTAPGAALHDLLTRCGAPLSLRELGMPEDGIERAAEIAMRAPYWNPRPFGRDDIRAIVAAAWRGDRPDG